MQIVAYPCLVMASINGFVGFFHLFVFFRERRTPVHLPFALLCFSVAMYDIFSIGLYDAHSVVEGVIYQKLQINTVDFISIFLTWFIAVYANQTRNKLIPVIVCWFAVLFIVSQFLGPELTVSPLRPSIKHINLTGFPSVTYYEGELGIVYEMGIASAVLIYLYLMFLLMRDHLGKGAGRSLIVFFGLCAYFIGAVNDTLVVSRFYQFIYLSEYSFMLVVLAMFYVLLSEIASLYHAVEVANTGLEAKVEERTREIRKLNEELSRGQAFLTALMDNIPDYIYFKDRESRFILNNRSHAQELGAGSPSEMLGKTDFDYFTPEHAQKAFDDEQRIIRTGQPLVNALEEETWENRPPTWMSSTKMPLRDENGEIIGTFGISRDMTERRQMEQKNLRLAAMIESSKDAIIGVGLDDSVTSWNKGAEGVFGYTAEEMIGQPITPLLSPDVQDQERTLNEKLTRKEAVQQFETLVQRKDGTKVYVSTTFSPIQDANGLIIGITSISRDVTDQRALQVQIIRSQRLESLGTLAAGIAHQFNNINAAAMAYLDIVAQDTTLPSATQSYVKEALKAVHRSVEITERLQGLTSAASTGTESLRLEEEVPTLLPLLEEKLQADGISIQIDFQETSPVRATRPTLRFIVTSLLSNSIHALLDCPSRLITLRTRSAAGFSSLEVSDTGCGIPPTNLPRVFTPFFTTKGEWAEAKSPQSRVKGVGLSLAVCQSTVGETGGWIEVESVPQQGSTFRVWFPAATSTPADTG